MINFPAQQGTGVRVWLPHYVNRTYSRYPGSAKLLHAATTGSNSSAKAPESTAQTQSITSSSNQTVQISDAAKAAADKQLSGQDSSTPRLKSRVDALLKDAKYGGSSFGSMAWKRSSRCLGASWATLCARFTRALGKCRLFRFVRLTHGNIHHHFRKLVWVARALGFLFRHGLNIKT
ncbi:hypothetical protein [Rhizorhapis sp. SPR117]|uniref:hypothetical protein n=1 Tax=Rhizorhapis sp. SPR117 TaxID=2912611 RepID=UPI001F1A73F7|nr:hypothetical protein [Rhizorhapis sp. SPR117]